MKEESKLIRNLLNTQQAVLVAWTKTDSIEEAGQTLLQLTCESLSWDTGLLWLRKTEGEALQLTASWNRWDRSPKCPKEVGGVVSVAAGCLLQRVYSSNKAVWIQDITRDPEFPNFCAMSAGSRGSAFALPLRSGSRLIGVIEFFTDAPTERNDDLIHHLETFGELIGHFIENTRARLQLKKAKSQLSLIAGLVNEVLWSIRFAENGTGNVEYVSKACLDVYGYSEEEFYEDPQLWMNAILPKDRAIASATYSKVLKTMGKERAVYRIRTKTGEEKWIEDTMSPVLEDGRLVGMAGLARDITEQMELQFDLQRSERNFRELIRKSPDGMIVHRFGPIVFANDAALKLLGYKDSSELIGRSVLDLIQSEDHPMIQKLMEQMKTDPSVVPPFETRGQKRNGETLLAEITAIPLQFSGESVVLGVFRDITERKKTEGQQLLSDRMISMGTMAAGVAHEINNPLAAVIANLEFLNDSGLNGEGFETKEALKDAREAASQIREIVRDLKIFSRTTDEKRHSVDVNKIVESSVRMAWNEIRHRARLVKDLGKIPNVHASESRLGQVFLNLVINAAQAIAEGAADENTIRVRTFVDGNGRVVIEFCDTGSGMTSEIRKRLFEPFFTTKPIGVGTGLGLPICHRIVSELGGEIEVESTPGAGSTFRIVLPGCKKDPEIQEKVAAASVPTRKGKLLVIDDEEAVCRSVSRILSRDHDVTGETNAQKALKRIEEGQQFDLILCDIMMPVMTGMEFYENLREKYPELAARVVFLTGGAFTANAQEFLNTLQNRHLEKPFDIQRLRGTIQEQLALTS